MAGGAGDVVCNAPVNRLTADQQMALSNAFLYGGRKKLTNEEVERILFALALTG